MYESVEMSLGVALVLDEVVKKVLLAKSKNENGEEILVDRELPFKLRYGLNKNRMILDSDVEMFNQKKLLLIAQYGEATEDNQNVVIKDPAKLELYKQEIGKIIDSKVTHVFYQLNPEDIEKVEDPDITVSPEAMTLFIGYMTNDPQLEKDLKFDIRVNTEVPDEKPVDTEEAPVVESTPNVEEKVEVPEEKPKKKRAPRKKKEN